jgi:hypothetical protein
MPVKAGTIDPSVVDISKLYLCPVRNVHYDSGLTSTASCESEITYIHGDEGVLLYPAIRSSRSPSMAISLRHANYRVPRNDQDPEDWLRAARGA